MELIEGTAKQPTMSVSGGVLVPVVNFLSDLGRAVSRLSLNQEKGQALVEFVFIGPLLLFFILIVVDFGIAMDRRELVQHAVREGARRAAVADGVAEIKESTHNQSAGTLDEGNVSVCFVDRNGNGDADAGDNVRVSGDYTYKFTVGGGEILAGFGIGPPSIHMSPSAEERLEKSGLGAPACLID